ncbi:MAG: hypothetical protein ABI778_03170 [Ignavibacteriota bacterium]
MKTEHTIWESLIEIARWSPSPHNIQPWRVRILSDRRAELYYDHRRLLPDTDPTSCFTILGLGMFIECMNIAAAEHGFAVHPEHESEPRLDQSAKVPKLFATLSLVEIENGTTIYDPALILKRKTSRLPYDGKSVADDVLQSLSRLSASAGHSFEYTSEAGTVDFIIDLNRETLFLDLDDDIGRKELSKWIRVSPQEAARKRDGLWSKCMRFPGWLMNNFFFHHERFRNPLLRRILGKVYSRSMRGSSTVAWLTGKFEDRIDWLRAGILLQRLWLEMTKHDVYLHPFGSVVTNKIAHKKFIEQMKIDESDQKLWLLMRLGYSKEPPRSYRLSTQEILLSDL